MAKKPDEAGTPPYLPWITFLNFLKQIKGSAIPTRVDSTILKGRSGSDQSGIKTALRFMGLIGPDDSVTQKFRNLIGAMDGDDWRETLGDIISESYLEITSSLDLDNGTLGELQQGFSSKGGVSGSVRDKAVRFYLSACREAGYTFSPHFGVPPAANGDGTRKAAPRTRRPRAVLPKAEGPILPPSADVKEVRFPLPGKPDVRIWLPPDLSAAEWTMLDTYLRAFIALSKAQPPTPPASTAPAPPTTEEA